MVTCDTGDEVVSKGYIFLQFWEVGRAAIFGLRNHQTRWFLALIISEWTQKQPWFLNPKKTMISEPRNNDYFWSRRELVSFLASEIPDEERQISRQDISCNSWSWNILYQVYFFCVCNVVTGINSGTYVGCLAGQACTYLYLFLVYPLFCNRDNLSRVAFMVYICIIWLWI